MKVEHFWYDDIQGRYLFLEWFAGHIDQIKHIEIKLPPFEHPETWWPDIKIHVASVEPPMGRIINVRRLSGLHTGSGRFTARIRDEYGPWNEEHISLSPLMVICRSVKVGMPIAN